jgi:hypothetical protein
VPLEGISHIQILGCNWQPVVTGVQDPGSNPEPSIERVARVVHSTGGRIGTQILLWVPPHDSMIRL